MRLARFSSVRSLAAVVVPLGVLFGASGCGEAVYYETEPVVVSDPGPVVWVETAPVVVIDDYPCEYYEGRPVYYIHGHWYYTVGGRWAYYRSEPAFLYERRYYYDSYGYRTARGEHRYRGSPSREGATASAPSNHTMGTPSQSGPSPSHSSGTPEHSSGAPSHSSRASIDPPAPRSAPIERAHPSEHPRSVRRVHPRGGNVSPGNVAPAPTTVVTPPPTKRTSRVPHRRSRRH